LKTWKISPLQMIPVPEWWKASCKTIPLFKAAAFQCFVVLFQLNQPIDSEIFPGFTIATCHASDASGTSLHRVSNLWIRDVFLVDSGWPSTLFSCWLMLVIVTESYKDVMGLLYPSFGIGFLSHLLSSHVLLPPTVFSICCSYPCLVAKPQGCQACLLNRRCLRSLAFVRGLKRSDCFTSSNVYSTVASILIFLRYVLIVGCLHVVLDVLVCQ
jgi:hypothetical protein